MYEKYSLSGSVPFVGAGLLICWVPVAAIILGIVYAVAQWFIPFIYACILITILYGVGIGFLAAWLAQRGHVRSPGFTFLVTFIGVLLGYYVMWGVHRIFVEGSPPEGVFAALYPWEVFAYIRRGYDQGFWALGKAQQNVSGIFLGLIWLIEFGIMVIAPPFIAAGSLMSRVYCETCGVWVPWSPLPRRFGLGTSEGWKERLQGGDWTAIAESPETPPEKEPHLRVKLARCHDCDGLAVLAVEQVTITTDDKGEKDEKTVELVENALLDPKEADKLVHDLTYAGTNAATDAETDEVEEV